tara:strand:+ start:26 stop:748 length:723 start_codon:yes stop_codon:yes gene_type:complete
MRFFTNGSEKFRIKSDGNVAINTTDPKEKLDTRGAAVFSGDHATSANAYGTAHGVMVSSVSGVGKITAISNGANDVNLELRALDGGSANASQLFLDGGNNRVGILKNNPSTALDVNGTVKATAFQGDGSALTNITGGSGEAEVKAWVNFNGTGTVAIRDSGNVSSVTDDGTGEYTVNFTTSLADANYCTQVTTRVTNALGTSGNINRFTAPSTSAVSVMCEIFNNPFKIDAETVCVTVFQ